MLLRGILSDCILYFSSTMVVLAASIVTKTGKGMAPSLQFSWPEQSRQTHEAD